MDRRKLAAVAGGLVLVTATIVVLRNETGPDEFEKFVDPSIELVAAQPPQKPADARITSLDPDSLQVAWTGNAESYDVRWRDQSVLVTTNEAEINGLNPDERVKVEIRAVNAVGQRSEPLTAEATPRELHDGRWDDQLMQPIDRFDGPESLDPRQWRIHGDHECLGLRSFGQGKRLDIACDFVELQSNRPLRLAVPASDGAVGRAVITAAGKGAITLQLLPEPLQDIPPLWQEPIQGLVQLELTSQGARINADPRLPRTDRQIELGDAPVTGLVPDVRHRWEVRILPDAVIALRDDVVVAAEPVKVPWPVAWPRISVRGDAMLDTFGIGGVPERSVPVSLVQLDTGGDALGKLPGQALSEAVSARLVLLPDQGDQNAVTVEVGGETLITRELSKEPRVLFAELPVRTDEPELKASRKVVSGYLVVQQKPGAGPGVLPRLKDREPEAGKALPQLTVMHETGAKPATQLPPDGRILVTAEVSRLHKAIELEVDGRRLLALPTASEGPTTRSRTEVWLKAADFAPGQGHRIKLTVLPPDQGEPVTTEIVFELREKP